MQVRGVSRTYGAASVLTGVDLELRAGEVLGLVGPNGGGKSTLLLLLAGLVLPSTGDVDVDGVPAWRVARQKQGTVGLITSDPGLYPLLTGRENLAFFGGLYGLKPGDVDRRAGPLLDALGVTPVLDHPVSAGSSGTRQKLSLARALLMSPRVLLLDEPTSNLDPVSAHTIWTTVREQADRGVAVALATHDLAAAEAICDRVAFVRGGILRVVTLVGARRAPQQGHLFDTWREVLG